MDILVSIIIPIFNTELYLSECIESVLNQSYKNIEIILVNDGSTDNSFNIIKNFALSDSRIVIINKENSGQGESRNIGLKKAKGKYVFFLDSDDYISETCIEHLVISANKVEADMVLYNANAFYEHNKDIIIENKLYHYVEPLYFNKVITGLDFLNYSKDYISPVLKLYKTKFLIENKIEFPNYKYGEDIYFWVMCSIYARKVFYINYIGYFRRVRNGSVTSKSNEFNVILDRIYSIKDINNLVYLIDQNQYRELKENFMVNYCYRILGAIVRIKNIKFKIYLIRRFKEEYGDKIIINNTKSQLKKCIVRLICFNMKKYK